MVPAAVRKTGLSNRLLTLDSWPCRQGHRATLLSQSVALSRSLTLAIASGRLWPTDVSPIGERQPDDQPTTAVGTDIGPFNRLVTSEGHLQLDGQPGGISTGLTTAVVRSDHDALQCLESFLQVHRSAGPPRRLLPLRSRLLEGLNPCTQVV